MGAAELKRLRADKDNALLQGEREREAFMQNLASAQQEHQQALRNALASHQEEAERLAAEKVGGTPPCHTSRENDSPFCEQDKEILVLD